MTSHQVQFQLDAEHADEPVSTENSTSLSSLQSISNLPDVSPQESSATDSLPKDPPDQLPLISSDGLCAEQERAETPESTSSEITNTVVIDDEALDHEVCQILRGPYIQQQLSLNIFSATGDLDISSKITVPRKRFKFAEKFRKLTKSSESHVPHAKFSTIFKFADKLDYLLMIIGSIAALGDAICYPLMLIVYKRVLDTFLSKSACDASRQCLLAANATNTNVSLDGLQGTINYFAILGAIVFISYCVAWSCWIISGERQVRRIRTTLFRSILRQEIGWFDRYNAGELNNHLSDDLDRIRDSICGKVPDFIATSAWLCSALIYALMNGWKLTLIFLSVSPFIVLTFNLTVKLLVKYTVKEVKAFACASAVVQEVLQSLRTVTAFHGQKKEEERFAKNLVEVQTLGVKKGIYVGICQGLTNVLNYGATAVALWYGMRNVEYNPSNIVAGTVLTVVFACMNVAKSAAQLIPHIQVFAEAASSGSYVFDIIRRKSKIDALSDDGEKPTTLKGDLQFENVSFTYPARQDTPILNKLTLKIPSGKTIAFVGSSGCGKSTIFQMIQRFYDPDEGRILLDGRNLSSLNISWLRSQIGIVSQEPVLFTGTIEDNIRFGKADATDEEVQAAAKLANAHDFIMTLPQNYKTPSGDKLSGGQKQRVAIARALISNPKILLLDEATSALDNTSERVVQDALDKAKEGRTTLVIAHRLSTIRNADLIIGLENGQVVEQGTHEESMKNKGLYYELVMAQTQKEEEHSDSESDDEDDKEDYALARQISVRREISRVSTVSVGCSEGHDRDVDLASLKDPFHYFKCLRPPFIFTMFKYNRAEWRWILLGLIVSLGYGASQPIFGLFFARVYDATAEPDADRRQRLIRNYALLCFFSGLAGGITQFLMSLSFAKSGEALTVHMRKLTLKAILRQEMNYFDEETNSVGALITRLSSDAGALKGLTGLRIGIILQSVGASLVSAIVGFCVSWQITLVALCFAPLIILAGKLRCLNEDNNDAPRDKPTSAEQGGQFATQAIDQIRTVMILRKEQYFIDAYTGAFNRNFKKRFGRAPLVACGAAMTDAMRYAIQFTCFSYGLQLVQRGEMNFTQVFSAFCVMILAMFAVARSLIMIPDYARAKAAALRIINLHERVSLIDPMDESGIILDDVKGEVQFVDVHFRYPTRPTVRILRHFSLKCLSKNTTALVGPSGSGKSTTVALLQRFYDPLRGQVLLDGHNIRVLNLRWLRSLMGLVQQEPVLFNLSIRENIAYGDNSRVVTQDEIEAAARMANIHDLIIALPQGYGTICGSKGSQLSGGQKQRIAIARALIRNPKILLLDEATSALDNKSERAVQGALDRARSNRSCLTIAHRLCAIQHSEQIVVVNRGAVAERGTHDELLKQRGVYAKLALAQKRTGNRH